MRDKARALAGKLPPIDLTGTKQALADFDAGKPDRDALWDDALTDADVLACMAIDATASELVARAYWHATQDRNSWATVKGTHHATIRAMVKKLESPDLGIWRPARLRNDGVRGVE